MNDSDNVPLNIVCFCGVEFIAGVARLIDKSQYYYKTEKFFMICPSCKCNLDVSNTWNPSE